MYSHYGPNQKPFFLYYNNDSVHLQFLLFLNLINSLTGVFSGLQQKNESSWPPLQATLQQMQRLPCPALPATLSATRTVSRSPRPTSSSLTVRLRLRTLIILSLSLLLSRSQQLALPVFKLTVLTSQCSLFLSLLLSLQLSSLRPWRRGKRNFRGLSSPTYIGERN